VTVLAESAMLADAWATAISVLGAEQGMQLANRRQLAVLAIIKTASGLKTLRSDKMAAYTET
jgi:thiamine biosynthesis lipoprotein